MTNRMPAGGALRQSSNELPINVLKENLAAVLTAEAVAGDHD